jgi:hypothetical protein
MPRRIIGQCRRSDFEDLIHIGDLMEKGQPVHLSNLTNREKVAVRVIHHFQQRNISVKVLAKIREILIWDMGNGNIGFEFKLMNPYDIKTRELLR